MGASHSTLVIFDLDGTLVDTGPDLLDSLNHTIATVGHQPVTLGDLDHLVGQGARAMIARALHMRGRPAEQDLDDRLLETFLTHYADNMPGRSKAFPGLANALDAFQEQGVALAVCTNKTEALSRRLLHALGLADRFATIVGGDTLAFRKPDGRHILGTIDMAGGDRRRSVMIGDSVNDIAAARSAGVVSVGVPFGYTDVPVRELGPDHVIEHFDELTIDLVDELLSRRAA